MIRCRAGNEAGAGYEASEPCGGLVHALMHVWELKRGSGGEGEFSPRLSDGPAHVGGGCPRPLRRVTGGSSRRGGIPPSSSRPADESPHGWGCRPAAVLQPLQMCTATHCHRHRHRMTPTEESGGQYGESPGLACCFIHLSSPRRKRWCSRYVNSL